MLLTVYQNTDFSADPSASSSAFESVYLTFILGTGLVNTSEGPSADSSNFPSVHSYLSFGLGPVNISTTSSWATSTNSILQYSPQSDNIGSPTTSVTPASKVFGKEWVSQPPIHNTTQPSSAARLPTTRGSTKHPSN